MKALTTTLLVSALTLAASSAHAADKLRLERMDLRKSPSVKMYLTYVDADGRVVSGKNKDDLKLIVDSTEQGAATDVKPFDTAGEPLHLVIVVQISAAMNEVLEEVKKGVRMLADAAGEKSKVAVLGYSADTKRLAEPGGAAEASAAANTIVVDNEGIEVHMLDAVRTSLDIMKAAPKGERKLVVLFSDGIDINMERKAFAAMGKKALEEGVVIDTIGYAPFEPGRLKNLSELSKQSNGNERSCKGVADVATQFGNVVDEVKKQYVTTFETNIKGDKKEHTFQAIIDSGGKSAYSNTISAVMPEWVHDTAVKKESSGWWKWLLLVLVILGIVGFLAWALFLRAKPEPEPVYEAPVAAPTPAPAAPAKTMAIDIGADNKSPVVGWIVGTSGKTAEKTFKLKAGRSLIGTGADADIQIDDQFCSSHHCEVRFEYGAYKIIDLGSTNGIVVNEKKVREHELVDNDMIRMGKTEFKFKTIA